MKKLFIFLIIVCISFAQNLNYAVILSKTKSVQIYKSEILYQYLYDLEQLNEILKLLNNPTFKEITKIIEMNFKTDSSPYSFEYIKNLLKVLNGINPEDDSIIGYYDKNNDIGGGYIKYIKDKFNNYYIFYLANIPYKNLIVKNFDRFKERIKTNLNILKKDYEEENNLKIRLKQIYFYLIVSLSEIENETKELQKENIIKPFNNYIDTKYALPRNIVKNKTTLYDIINFILNGNKKYKILGIRDYYEIFYKNDIKPFVIVQ